MTAQATAKKGRLEHLLDEFTDVHGTVLLGMHKEIQTLKDEVEKSVDARVGAVLAKIQCADGELAKRLSDSLAATRNLKQTTKTSLQSLESSSSRIEELTAYKLKLADDAAGVLLENVAKSTVDFNTNSTRSMQMLATICQEFESKMAAKLAYVNTINAETKSMLTAIEARQTQLEIRTRQIFIGGGILLLATLGVWIWLTIRN